MCQQPPGHKGIGVFRQAQTAPPLCPKETVGAAHHPRWIHTIADQCCNKQCMIGISGCPGVIGTSVLLIQRYRWICSLALMAQCPRVTLITPSICSFILRPSRLRLDKNINQISPSSSSGSTNTPMESSLDKNPWC